MAKVIVGGEVDRAYLEAKLEELRLLEQKELEEAQALHPGEIIEGIATNAKYLVLDLEQVSHAVKNCRENDGVPVLTEEGHVGFEFRRMATDLRRLKKTVFEVRR